MAKLDTLIGCHVLTGVNFDTCYVEEDIGDASVMNFVLDGVMYSAIEDASDGYRSSMSELRVTTVRATRKMNMFSPCNVIGSMRVGDSWILDLEDVETKKIVLSVGTDQSDDWYPWFVSKFSPENMSSNWRTLSMWGDV